ncbi:MAG: hypothetical protein M9949_14575, partial [Candidatus Kapabacteria bacterium]|nr:hypothetical protein [Candidatus Kapabacteria bacterium]
AHKYYKIFSSFEFVIPDSLDSQIADFTFKQYINDMNQQGNTVAIKSLVVESQADWDENEIAEQEIIMFGITSFYLFKPDSVGKAVDFKQN